MAKSDGAKGVPAGELLRVRDIRAMRVRVLNTAKLHGLLVGKLEAERLDIDAIGATEEDPRGLLPRVLGVLLDIAQNDRRSAMRYRAAKTIAETVQTLTAEEAKARAAVAQLAQQSQEHADKMALGVMQHEGAVGSASGNARAQLEAIAARARALPGPGAAAP